jgi:hypothetical protein
MINSLQVAKVLISYQGSGYDKLSIFNTIYQVIQNERADFKIFFFLTKVYKTETRSTHHWTEESSKFGPMVL